ncbi:hypothetical protein L596_026388 [Steinernema carpocapsae]|uniref:CUB domain-containing protein n=1 Tax=Steinernema carpocapsae TaxID=34508 RepID=A0A4U5M177_STECR|nr:hypothetical protein L596_026388 [Steinernema carpocapsae]
MAIFKQAKTPSLSFLLRMLFKLWPLLALALTPCEAIKWINCNSTEASKPIELSQNEAIGIRSYDWPNSMTMFDGQQRQNCSIMVRNTILTTQRIAMVFLNARLGAVFNGGHPKNVDTNDDGRIISHTFDESFTFAVANWSWDCDETAVSVWNGFEALVIGYEQRSSCPFQTEQPTVVEPNDPKLLTAFIDDDDDDSLSCSWNFLPKEGYTLKLVVSNSEAILSRTVVVTVDGIVQPYASVQPYIVYYAKKSLNVTYDWNEDQDPESFFGVLSSFLTQPSDSSQCPQKTQNLIDLTSTTTISVNQDTNTKAFWTPYANNENCVSQIQTEKDKELRFYVDTRDMERSDSAMLALDNDKDYNMRTDDLTIVLATKDNDTATLTWKSDGNYGRSGFSLHVDVLDCSCGSNLITLSSTTPKVVFGPSKPYYKSGVAQDRYNPYCRNMSCIWTVDRPDDSIMVLTQVGQTRTFDDDDDTLRIRTDGTQKMTQWSNNFLVFGKELKVGLRSLDKWPQYQSDDHDLHFEASLLTYSDMTAEKTVFNTSVDFSIFETSTLSEQFSAHTFVLGPDMTSKKIQIYMVQNDMCDNRDFNDLFGIFDGELNPATVANVTFWPQQCSQTYGYSNVVPFVSTTGSVTIMRLHQDQGEVPTLIVKVYDDDQDCTLQDPLFVVHNDSASFYWSPSSHNRNQTRCPAYVYVDYPGFPSIDFRFSGFYSDQSVQVFGGWKVSGTPLFTFNRDSAPTVYGKLFTLFVATGTTLNIKPTLQEVDYGTKWSYDGDTVRGVFMSPVYPLGSFNASSISESLTIQPPDASNDQIANLNGTLTVVIKELESTSSLMVTLGSKLLSRLVL